jgi:hypothetical protein
VVPTTSAPDIAPPKALGDISRPAAQFVQAVRTTPALATVRLKALRLMSEVTVPFVLAVPTTSEQVTAERIKSSAQKEPNVPSRTAGPNLIPSNHIVQKLIKEAWLTDAQGRQLTIKLQGATRLGRSSENDVVLEDSTVSQRHAMISFDGGRAFLRDLGSSNGTFIAGARVSGGQLSDGTEIKLGRVSLAYRESVDTHPVAAFGGCTTCGELIGAGSQFCARCGSRLVAPLPNSARTSSAGTAAHSKRAFFSARTGAILGGLFLLGAFAALALQGLSFPSHSSGSYSGMGNLTESQSFALPEASSDFVGDWCGWAHVSSCDPPGSCEDESVPNSMSFKSDAGWFSSNSHSVTLQYTILTAPNTHIEDIQVRALDPHHVEVTYVAKRRNANDPDYTLKKREDIVSVGPGIVRDTEHLLVDKDGTEAREETSAALTKCSDEFEAAEQQYIEQHQMVENGEVSGQVPSR